MKIISNYPIQWVQPSLLLSFVLLGACADPAKPPPVIPSAGTMAGTEVPAGTVAGTNTGACVGDSSCAAGTVCNTTTGVCVPGQCSLTTMCPAGQTCDFNTFTCSGSSTPPCTSDANCASGFCIAGMCQNVECVRDENCAMGNRCEGMRCVADTSCIDGDRDGYGVNCSAGPDCDDGNANVNSGAPENGATNCNDGVDNNCDGVDSICGSDEDADNDGYAEKDGDCDDGNANVNPGRPEVYYNDLDDDCDPRTNDDDQDGDGFAAEMSGGPDCDDDNAMINPDAQDIPMNGVDEDCDGSYNEGCSVQLLDCGGPGSLQPGRTVGCNFSTRVVTGIRIRGGCNDGESGNYTITFSDGTSVNFNAGCGTTYSISDKVTSNATLYMNSGGGGDNNISWTCCGSSGHDVYYR